MGSWTENGITKGVPGASITRIPEKATALQYGNIFTRVYNNINNNSVLDPHILGSQVWDEFQAKRKVRGWLDNGNWKLSF